MKEGYNFLNMIFGFLSMGGGYSDGKNETLRLNFNYRLHLAYEKKCKEKQYKNWGVKCWSEYGNVWARNEKNAKRKFHNLIN
jgi:hypothetical protein